jgi:hypothetical protein
MIALPSTAAAPVFTLQNGFPSNILDPNNPTLTKLVRARSINPNDPEAVRAAQWSAGFQRLLPGGLFIDL